MAGGAQAMRHSCCAARPESHDPSPVPRVLCPMPYALCPMPYARCPKQHPLCGPVKPNRNRTKPCSPAACAPDQPATDSDRPPPIHRHSALRWPPAAVATASDAPDFATGIEQLRSAPAALPNMATPTRIALIRHAKSALPGATNGVGTFRAGNHRPIPDRPPGQFNRIRVKPPGRTHGLGPAAQLARN